jgi:hypothetical protein
MWRTPTGVRTLSGPEAALMREAMAYVADSLHDEADGFGEEWPCGVKVFDELSWQQRLALLSRVANALLKSDVAAPELSAVNEATVAALFAHISRNIIIEVDQSNDPEFAAEDFALHWRRLIAACQSRPSVDQEFFVAVDSSDLEEWDLLIESISGGILWDNDWAMQDLYLDADPGISRREKRRMGIESNYFTMPAPDIRDEQAPAVFAELRELMADVYPPTEP